MRVENTGERIEKLLVKENLSSSDCRFLESIIEKFKESDAPDDLFLCGYIIYHFHNFLNINLSYCEKFFKKSLILDPDAINPLWYLGCYYFDQKIWADAIKCFHKIKSSDSKNHLVTWKKLKLQELLLAADIQTSRKINYTMFDELIDLYDSVNVDDRPWPSELIESLKSLGGFSFFYDSPDNSKYLYFLNYYT